MHRRFTPETDVVDAVRDALSLKPHFGNPDRMSHQCAGKKYHGAALIKNLNTIIENAKDEKKAGWEEMLTQVE